MKLSIAVLLSLVFSLSVIPASATEIATFVKDDFPETSVWTENGTPLEQSVAKSIVAAFVADNWVDTSGAWENVPDANKAIAEKSDPGIGCHVSVRQIDTSKKPLAYIEMECGPLNTYGNGIWFRASYNDMVVDNPESMGKNVPSQVMDMYRKYVELQKRGMTGFMLRGSDMPRLSPLGKLPTRK